MQAVMVTASEAGRRLDRYLMKLLPQASKGLIYKNLRGNGFRINGKRIRDPEYIVRDGDILAIYLNDDQLKSLGFVGHQTTDSEYRPLITEWNVPVIYEDGYLVIFNKPAGLLSQKNTESSISLTEIGMDYLYRNGLILTAGFKPGVVNRLDQNTSGAVIMGKNLEAAQAASAMIRDRMIDKFYYAIVSGCAEWNGERECIHYFYKDEKANRLHLSEKPVDKAGKEVRSKVSVLSVNQEHRISLLRVQLMTGKSHQIRSQLSKIGFPILGDPKYRDTNGYQQDKKRYHVHHQLLCAQELFFRETVPPLQNLTGKRIYAQLPDDMNSIISHYFTKR